MAIPLTMAMFPTSTNNYYVYVEGRDQDRATYTEEKPNFLNFRIRRSQFPIHFHAYTCPEVLQEKSRKVYSKLQPILLQEIRNFSGQVQDYWPVLDLAVL